MLSRPRIFQLRGAANHRALHDMASTGLRAFTYDFCVLVTSGSRVARVWAPILLCEGGGGWGFAARRCEPRSSGMKCPPRPIVLFMLMTPALFRSRASSEQASGGSEEGAEEPGGHPRRPGDPPRWERVLLAFRPRPIGFPAATLGPLAPGVSLGEIIFIFFLC